MKENNNKKKEQNKSEGNRNLCGEHDNSNYNNNMMLNRLIRNRIRVKTKCHKFIWNILFVCDIERERERIATNHWIKHDSKSIECELKCHLIFLFFISFFYIQTNLFYSIQYTYLSKKKKIIKEIQQNEIVSRFIQHFVLPISKCSSNQLYWDSVNEFMLLTKIKKKHKNLLLINSKYAREF